MPDRITVTSAGPVGMVSLRGAFDVLGPAISTWDLALPETRMLVRAGGRAALWMSPDELLLLCDHGEAADLAARLRTAFGDAFASATVLGDARSVFDLRGDGIEGALASLCPVDFARMAPDEVRRTRLAQVPAAMWRDGGGWRVVCFRSVSDYVARLLENATA